MEKNNKNHDRSLKQKSGQTGVETNSKKRTKRFEVRFTPEEFASLIDRAENEGFSSTALFARSILLPKDHRQNQETKTEHKLRVQLLASLGKIGSNINQIARSLNRMKTWNDTTKGMLVELEKIQQGISTIIDAFKGRL